MSETVGLRLLDVFALACRYPKPETLDSMVWSADVYSGQALEFVTKQLIRASLGPVTSMAPG